MSLSHRIRQLRYEKGWGLNELAARARVSRTTLYQIESGRTTLPRASTLRRVAEVLEVATDALIGDPPPPAREPSPPQPGPFALDARESRLWRENLEYEQMFRILLGSRLRETVASVVQESFRILTQEASAPPGRRGTAEAPPATRRRHGPRGRSQREPE